MNWVKKNNELTQKSIKSMNNCAQNVTAIGSRDSVTNCKFKHLQSDFKKNSDLMNTNAFNVLCNNCRATLLMTARRLESYLRFVCKITYFVYITFFRSALIQSSLFFRNKCP